MFIHYKEWCPNQFSAVSYCILFFLLSDLILCRLLVVINSFVLYLDVSCFLCDSGSYCTCDNFNCKLSLQLILCISAEEDGIGLVLTIHVSYLIVLYHYFYFGTHAFLGAQFRVLYCLLPRFYALNLAVDFQVFTSGKISKCEPKIKSPKPVSAFLNRCFICKCSDGRANLINFILEMQGSLHLCR